MLAPALLLCALVSAAPLSRVTVDEADPKRAAFLREALAAMLESPTAAAVAKDFEADGPSVTVRWGPLESAVLQVEGAKTVVSGLSGYTQHTSSASVVTMNARLLEASTPRELAPHLAHEVLGHAYERALAERAGMSYGYTLTRDNETAACLLQWIVAAELGLPQIEGEPFKLLSSPERYHAERVYLGEDYAAALPPAQFEKAREVFVERAGLLAERAKAWREIEEQDAVQLRWIRHFVEKHAWPEPPFSVVKTELEHERAQEAPRQRRVLARAESTLRDLASALAEEKDEQGLLRRAAGHPLTKRWAGQVRDRTARLRALLRRRSETAPATQPRPSGALTLADLERMIEADRPVHPEP